MAKFSPANFNDISGKRKRQIWQRLWFVFVFMLVLSTSPIRAQIHDLTIDNTYTIAAGATLEVNNLTVNDTLIINGTLIVYGSLFTGNNSVIEANAGSSIFIFQDANLANQVTVDLSSYFIVLGNFNKDGAHNQGSLLVSGAHMYIFGEIDLPDKGWEDFSICSPGAYDGITSSAGDTCDAGQYDDFIDNVVPDDLPENLYQQILEKVNGCVSPEIINPGNRVSCEDYMLPEIEGTNLVNPKYFDNSQMLGGNEISGAITTTQTIWIYDEAAGGCFDEEQFLVTINPVPTAIISGDATICDDGSTTNIGIEFTGTPPWKFTIQRNGSNDVQVENITLSPHALPFSEPGVYTLTDFADAWCSGTASGTAAITVNPLPLTGEIIPD